MELKQLEYFLMVSNLKSFTKAAEQLYISQPSVTTAIRRLEDELGIILFEKNKKQAILTPEGEIFYGHTAIVMEDVSKATQKAAELKNLNSGVINFGISSLTSLSISSFLLAKFHTIYPALKINFIEDGSANIREMIENDKLDLGFIILENPIDVLETVCIGQEPLYVYLPLFHLLKDRNCITLKELQNEFFILPKENCSLRKILFEALEEEKIIPHISFETNYLQMVKQLIISGSGIAVLPKGAIENNAICSIPLTNSPQISIGIARKKNKCISYAAQTLYTFLENSFTP